MSQKLHVLAAIDGKYSNLTEDTKIVCVKFVMPNSIYAD